MAVKVKGTPIEAKPVAGMSTVAVIGYAVALTLALWPSLAARIPMDLQLQAPVVLATVLGSIASYIAPHTNRPDLVTVVPPAQPVAPVAPAVPPVQP
jgi:hypothetical protein